MRSQAPKRIKARRTNHHGSHRSIDIRRARPPNETYDAKLDDLTSILSAKRLANSSAGIAVAVLGMIKNINLKHMNRA